MLLTKVSTGLREKKKLLFVSNSSGNRISHILDAFKNRQDLKIEVLHQYVNEISQTFITKLFEKIKFPRDIDCLNQRLLKKIEDFKPEIIFIIKGNCIYPSTLKKII